MSIPDVGREFCRDKGNSRGGRDQFSWEKVKEDKHRESYLGNSLYASVGLWQKNKNLQWFAQAKENSDPVDYKEEIRMEQLRERAAMNKALGLPVFKETQSLEALQHSNKDRLSDAEIAAITQTGDNKKLEENHGERLSSCRKSVSSKPDVVLDAFKTMRSKDDVGIDSVITDKISTSRRRSKRSSKDFESSSSDGERRSRTKTKKHRKRSQKRHKSSKRKDRH